MSKESKKSGPKKKEDTSSGWSDAIKSISSAVSISDDKHGAFKGSSAGFAPGSIGSQWDPDPPPPPKPKNKKS